ncbi:MAG: hypothetical protein GY795_44675 [Desulfobacterales bacterium]|nr:hypothetical protein [Desulfobacterales bacterium]
MMNKKLIIWGIILFLMIMSPGIFLATVLFFSAETSASRFFALSILALFVATILLAVVIRRFQKPVLIYALAMYSLGIIGLLGCYLASPSGHSSQNSHLRSFFPTGKTKIGSE